MNRRGCHLAIAEVDISGQHDTTHCCEPLLSHRTVDHPPAPERRNCFGAPNLDALGRDNHSPDLRLVGNDVVHLTSLGRDMSDTTMLQSLLKATLLFADLDDASLDRVAATADERTLRRGDVLFTR